MKTIIENGIEYELIGYIWSPKLESKTETLGLERMD